MTSPDIKSIRETYGLTKSQLADEVGTTWETVQNWELGKHRPQHAFRRKLSQLAENGPRFPMEDSVSRNYIKQSDLLALAKALTDRDDLHDKPLEEIVAEMKKAVAPGVSATHVKKVAQEFNIPIRGTAPSREQMWEALVHLQERQDAFEDRLDSLTS